MFLQVTRMAIAIALALLVNRVKTERARSDLFSPCILWRSVLGALRFTAWQQKKNKLALYSQTLSE